MKFKVGQKVEYIGQVLDILKNQILIIISVRPQEFYLEVKTPDGEHYFPNKENLRLYRNIFNVIKEKYLTK